MRNDDNYLEAKHCTYELSEDTLDDIYLHYLRGLILKTYIAPSFWDKV